MNKVKEKTADRYRRVKLEIKRKRIKKKSGGNDKETVQVKISERRKKGNGRKGKGR